MKPRPVLSGAVMALVVAAALALHAQTPRPAAPYVALTAEGRRPIAAATVGDRELLRLEDLAALFQLTVREDRAGNALTLTRGGTTVVLSLDQGLASLNGRLISLSSPPVRDGAGWLVAPDVVVRAVGVAAATRLDVRRASRLVVVGDLRVPRLSIRQEATGAGTRVSIDVTPRASYTVRQEGRRLVVRFDADGLDATSAVAASGGLLESLATTEPATLTLNLTAAFASFRTSTIPVDAASSRVVIDLLPAGASAPPPTRPTPPERPPAPPAPLASEVPTLGQAQPPALRTVVIDPGHGGDETGARGAGGAREKDVTLDVARRLKAALEGRLGIRVLLTRDEDRLVPIDERAAIANNNKADLFLSLHVNSSPRAETRGAEVFSLSLDGYGEDVRRIAETSPASALPTFGGGSRTIDLIPWEMAQARHLEESGIFAGMVEEELRRRVDMSERPSQQAPFRVLVAANMPAVLVEMAFVSNAEQEAQLTSDEFKNAVVQSLYDAILRYRARIETPAPRRRP